MRDKALVVFSGKADFWWQNLLRPGFRHCAVIVKSGQHWIALEPVSNRLQTRVLMNNPDSLAGQLLRRGLHVVETNVVETQLGFCVPGLWTCVEVVKRALGIKRVSIQTPWHLYQHLLKENKKKILETP